MTTISTKKFQETAEILISSILYMCGGSGSANGGGSRGVWHAQQSTRG